MKKISILDMKKQTIKGSVIEAVVKFTDINDEEVECQVFVKKLSYSAIMEINRAYEFDFVDGKAEYKGLDIARLQAGQVLHSICKDKAGNALFQSINEVYEIIPSLGFALHAASDEVNNFSGKLKTKNSSEKNSGASLPLTESVEEQSKSVSETSATQKPPSGENIAAEEAASI